MIIGDVVYFGWVLGQVIKFPRGLTISSDDLPAVSNHGSASGMFEELFGDRMVGLAL